MLVYTHTHTHTYKITKNITKGTSKITGVGSPVMLIRRDMFETNSVITV